jgi:hypothetical protein
MGNSASMVTTSSTRGRNSVTHEEAIDVLERDLCYSVRRKSIEEAISAYLEARGAILCEKKISVLLYGEGKGLVPLHAPLKIEGGADGNHP